MATNKQRLKGMLSPPREPSPAAPATIQRGTPFSVSTTSGAETDDAPLQSAALSAALQEIARRYVNARRRSGEALLEAARWLSEARDLAEHGEWQVFLDATGTSADSAERLLNIHSMAMQHPQFADSITRGWLSQSAAALLARSSTPLEVIGAVLSAETPPTVAEVERAIRKAKRAAPGENPQIADFASVGVGGEIPQIADFGSEEARNAPVDDMALKLLQDAAALLSELASRAERLPSGEATDRAMQQVAQAIAVLQSSLVQRTH